jgi:hypothetical protein
MLGEVVELRSTGQPGAAVPTFFWRLWLWTLAAGEQASPRFARLDGRGARPYTCPFQDGLAPVWLAGFPVWELLVIKIGVVTDLGFWAWYIGVGFVSFLRLFPSE